jgi:hypothetical protein
MSRIEDKAKVLDSAVAVFRKQQTNLMEPLRQRTKRNCAADSPSLKQNSTTILQASTELRSQGPRNGRNPTSHFTGSVTFTASLLMVDLTL